MILLKALFIFYILAAPVISHMLRPKSFCPSRRLEEETLTSMRLINARTRRLNP